MSKYELFSTYDRFFKGGIQAEVQCVQMLHPGSKIWRLCGKICLGKIQIGGRAEKINRKQTLYDRDLTGAELTGAVVATVDGHQFFWDPAALDPLKWLE